MLRRCYANVTQMLRRCYANVTQMLRRCYADVTLSFEKNSQEKEGYILLSWLNIYYL